MQEVEARKKRRAIHGIAGQLSAAGYLPPLPLPTPEIGLGESIRFSSLASVKKALKRRGLSLNSIGLKGEERLVHLGKRLKIALAREEEAMNEAALCKELASRNKSVVTIGVLGRERIAILSKRLYDYRSKELVRLQAQEKMAIWKNIAGKDPVERRKTFQEYNKDKYLKLFSAAIAINNYPEVQRLIELGCDPDFETKAGHSALRQAATFNRIELAKWLCSHGAKVDFQGMNGRTALTIASALGYTDMMKTLLSLGADVNFETTSRKTALMMAAKEGRESSVLVLIAHGVDINAQNCDGTTALMVAAVSGQLHVVRLLLQHNADVEIVDHDGKDALIAAKLAHAHDAVKQLELHIEKLPKDLRRKSIDKKGNFIGIDNQEEVEGGKQKPKGLGAVKIYQNAIVGNDFDVVCRLIRRKMVKPNVETVSGETALMRASWYGRVKEMELLLAMGSEVDYQNKKGRSALMSAAKNNQPDAIDFLISWGAYIQLQDVDGWTALMLAAENGSTEAVRSLISHGAFVNHRNSYGKTAFVAAIGSGQGSTASLLMPRDAAMGVLETTVAKLAKRGLVGLDDGGNNNADVQTLIAKGIPTAGDLCPKKVSSVTKGVRKIRNTDVIDLAQAIADDVDLEMVERMEQQAIERGNIEAARKRGRREAVTDILTSPLKNVPEKTAVHIDPKSFTFSMDICEEVLNGMRENLAEVQKKIEIIVKEGGTVPEIHLDYFSDPAELRLAAFYIQVGENWKSANMLKASLDMQRNRFGENHYEVAKSLNTWGALYAAMGRFDRAVTLHEKAKKILIHNHGHMHVDVAMTFNLLVNAHIGNKSFEQASTACAEQFKVLRRKLDRHHPLCKEMSQLGRKVEKKMCEFEKSEKKRKEAELKEVESQRRLALKHARDQKEWEEKNQGLSLAQAYKGNLPPGTKALMTIESMLTLIKKDALFLKCFKKFSRYAYFKNELNFILEVERFRKTSKKDSEFGNLALSIFRRYILTPFLPALGQESRQRVKQRIKQLHNAKELVDKRSLIQQMKHPQNLFDEAQTQLLGIMHSGAYQEFYPSKYGRRYLMHRVSVEKHTNAWTAFQAHVRKVLAMNHVRAMLAEYEKEDTVSDETERKPFVSNALEEKFQEVVKGRRFRNGQAAKIQCMYRTWKARKEVKAMLKRVIVQRFDPSSNQYYYMNTQTGESSWTQPIMLQQH